MLNYFETIKALPPEYPGDLQAENRESFLAQNISIIVLDDDPTGTQTIFDVPVLTSWGVDDLCRELQNETPLFFILTNSRSLVAKDADKLAIEIGHNIRSAAHRSGRKTLVISRGDSTLRGHYPNEVVALGQGLGIENSPQILIPAFFQGGRYTINDIHYVREGDHLIPAAETPFARDSSFAYKSSDLKAYVVEKSAEKIKAEQVVSLGLKSIREGGPHRVFEILAGLKKDEVCIVNAASQNDLDVFTAGFYKWYTKDKTVLFRTAASIIPSLAGISVKTPLNKSELPLKGNGGVIAVGSYVPKTSLQLEYLRAHYDVEYVEIKAAELLLPGNFTREVERVSDRINSNLKQDRVVVVYTSRKLISGATPEESLKIVNQISAGMVDVIRGISVRPRFFIAKGGITSSHIATKAFKAKRAWVSGQIIPGVPVWKLEDCQPFPGLVYMPFPGNLGGDDAVFNAVRKLV